MQGRTSRSDQRRSSTRRENNPSNEVLAIMHQLLLGQNVARAVTPQNIHVEQ
jgi:hypothetical protein